MPNNKGIERIIKTVKKHGYNYDGNDVNKIREIGAKLYELKKKHKIVPHVKKSTLCATTDKWLEVAIIILAKIANDRL